MEELPIEDRWILSRLATTTAAVTEQLEGYHFSEVARTIYDFTWSEFCDWYVEMSKGRLRDAASRPLAQRVLVGVLDAHPAAGAADHAVRGRVDLAGAERGGLRARPAGAGAGGGERGDRGLAERSRRSGRTPAMERRIARMQELVRAVREVRNRYMVDPKTPLDVFVRCRAAVAARLRAAAAVHQPAGRRGQAGVRARTWPSRRRRPATSTPEFEAYVSLPRPDRRGRRRSSAWRSSSPRSGSTCRDAGEAGQRQLRRQGAAPRWCSSRRIW